MVDSEIKCFVCAMIHSDISEVCQLLYFDLGILLILTSFYSIYLTYTIDV